MIWNSRKPKLVEIDGVKWTVKPFNAIEHAEYLERISSKQEGLKDRVKHNYETLEWLLNTIVKDVQGLKNESGEAVEFNAISKKELALGFGMEDFSSLCNALIEVNTVPEDVKKKSLPLRESGTDT